MNYTDTEKKIFWAGINLPYAVHTFFKLMAYYGDVDEMWEHFDPTDPKLAALNDKTRHALAKSRNMSWVEQQIAALKENSFLPYTKYPELLSQVEDAPIILYYRGKIDFPRCVAMVGTRNATKYGKDVAESFARQLAGAGVTIVSGGARGIDSAAHRGVLSVGSSTVCVLGCGIDIVYPPENNELFLQIVENGGGILSEYPPGTPPEYFNFPARNRLISGLSTATILVESGERSGAHITARFAAEQGRDVFCVPGNITSKASAGTNKLIQDGARVLLHAEEILEEYNWGGQTKQTKKVAPPDLNKTEQKIVDALNSTKQSSIDELTQCTGIALPELGANLTMLELKGVVKQLPGKVFALF